MEYIDVLDDPTTIRSKLVNIENVLEDDGFLISEKQKRLQHKASRSIEKMQDPLFILCDGKAIRASRSSMLEFKYDFILRERVKQGHKELRLDIPFKYMEIIMDVFYCIKNSKKVEDKVRVTLRQSDLLIFKSYLARFFPAPSLALSRVDIIESDGLEGEYTVRIGDSA